MYKCKYCGKNYDVLQSVMGHSTHCINNPNHAKNLELHRKKRIILKNPCKKCGILFEQEIKENGKNIIKQCCYRKCSSSRNFSEKSKLKIGNSKRKYPISYINICKCCKKQFVVSHRQRNKKTCSNECRLSITIPILKMNSETICKTDEFKKKISVGNLLAYKNGKNVPIGCKQYKCGWHKSWSGKSVYLRSSYEKKIALHFDYLKIHYEVESERIKYILNDKEHTYVADFFIPSLNMIIETKCNYFYIRDKEKVDKYIKQCEDLGYVVFLLIDKQIDDFILLFHENH
jgi:hypothetical protein